MSGSSGSEGDAVKVAVRIRPLNEKEVNEQSQMVTHVHSDTELSTPQQPHS